MVVIPWLQGEGLEIIQEVEAMEGNLPEDQDGLSPSLLLHLSFAAEVIAPASNLLRVFVIMFPVHLETVPPNQLHRAGHDVTFLLVKMLPKSEYNSTR